MTEMPGRRWFHFQLSTVMIAMVITGAFIGLNLVVRHPSFDDWDGLDQIIGEGFVVSKTSFGFAFAIYDVRVWRSPSVVQEGVGIFEVLGNLVALAVSIFFAKVAFNVLIRYFENRKSTAQ